MSVIKKGWRFRFESVVARFELRCWRPLNFFYAPLRSRDEVFFIQLSSDSRPTMSHELFLMFEEVNLISHVSFMSSLPYLYAYFHCWKTFFVQSHFLLFFLRFLVQLQQVQSLDILSQSYYLSTIFLFSILCVSSLSLLCSHSVHLVYKSWQEVLRLLTQLTSIFIRHFLFVWKEGKRL